MKLRFQLLQAANFPIDPGDKTWVGGKKMCRIQESKGAKLIAIVFEKPLSDLRDEFVLQGTHSARIRTKNQNESMILELESNLPKQANIRQS